MFVSFVWLRLVLLWVSVVEIALVSHSLDTCSKQINIVDSQLIMSSELI